MPENSSIDPTSGVDSVGKAVRRNLSPKRIAGLIQRGMKTFSQRGVEATYREMEFRYRLATHGQVWKYRADIPLQKELKEQRKAGFEKMPLISVVVPLYNTPTIYLCEMVDSVREQSYPHWELILIDGSDSKHAEVGKMIASYSVKDKRIKGTKLYKNTGIAENTNVGFSEANGEWIILLDHDDVFQPNALYEVVKTINETNAQVIYSDEIVLSGNLKELGEYHFKPNFGPDTLRGCNYITHLCAFSAELLRQIGGKENSDYDGAQDYDLILRLTEKAAAVVHIPKVLYFWRRHESSTAKDISQKPYALDAGARAIEAQLARLQMQGEASPLAKHAGSYRVKYVVENNPKVSVIIPNKDHTNDLERCLDSFYEKSGWDNFEVIVVENNSTLPETKEFYTKAEKKYPNLQIVYYEGGFNFSAICNCGVAEASGEHLLLLNNDVEILSDDFLYEMLSYSQRAGVGAVGALLFYPDDTVQHAGLFVGIGGTAGVNHKGHKRGDGGDMFRLCTVQNMSAVTGAALLVKKSIYLEENGLDETSFAVAFNDVDFCLRLRERGLWNVFTPFAQAYHYESKSRGYDLEGPAKERFDREKAAFQARHAKILAEGDPFYNPHFTLDYENYGYK